MNGGRERNIANTFLSSDPKRGQLRLLLPSWPVRRARIQQLGDELRAGRRLTRPMKTKMAETARVEELGASGLLHRRSSTSDGFSSEES
jgi:hypothetical protein